MFIQKIKDFFNWKKNPQNVFYLAIPLFLVGFGSHVAVAYLEWSQNGDPVYAYIMVGALALFAFGLWPVRKQLLKSLL